MGCPRPPQRMETKVLSQAQEAGDHSGASGAAWNPGAISADAAARAGKGEAVETFPVDASDQPSGETVEASG